MNETLPRKSCFSTFVMTLHVISYRSWTPCLFSLHPLRCPPSQIFFPPSAFRKKRMQPLRRSCRPFSTDDTFFAVPDPLTFGLVPIFSLRCFLLSRVNPFLSDAPSVSSLTFASPLFVASLFPAKASRPTNWAVFAFISFYFPRPPCYRCPPFFHSTTFLTRSAIGL